MLTAASAVYATVTARNTPRYPTPNFAAINHATGISNTQNTARLIFVGVHVSPAPLNACVSTMPNAKNGNPAPIARSPNTATSATAGSDVKADTMTGANAMNTKPICPRNTRL